MHIIGIAGLIGSGKDEVASYIKKKYGYIIVLNMGDVLREMAKKMGLELTRDTFQNLRIKYGNNFLAEEIVKRIKENNYDKVIINGIRRSEDFLMQKKAFPKMRLIVVKADEKIRFQRLKKRGRENDPKTLEEFHRQEKRENEIYDFEKTFSYADFTIENNGTFDGLYKEIDKVMWKIEK